MASEGPSKKRKFVQKGIFYAELNDFLRTELEQDVEEGGFSIGYAGVEVRNTLDRLEVIIRATKTKHVVGTQGRRIRELTKLVEKRFNISKDKGGQQVELFAERVQHRALCALAQAEAVKFKLMEGLAVRRACYRALRFIMENEAKGCEIIVSGKLRGQRAKAMKFKQGYMITSGEATNTYIDTAVKHVKLRQGVLGIKVKIMLPHDAAGQQGPATMLPDKVEILESKFKRAAWELKEHELAKGYAQQVPEPEFAEDGGMQQQMEYDPNQAGMDQQGGGFPAQDARDQQQMDPNAGMQQADPNMAYQDPNMMQQQYAQQPMGGEQPTPGGQYAQY